MTSIGNNLQTLATNITKKNSEFKSDIDANTNDISDLKDNVLRLLCAHPMYQFLHPDNRLSPVCYFDPLHYGTASLYEDFISISKNSISILENDPQGYGVYHLSNKQGFYKFKITVFAYTEPVADLIYRAIKNGKTTNDLMLVEDGDKSVYVKDIIIGHFGCRKGGEKAVGQGIGNEYFKFHVTNILSGRSKDEVIKDNFVGPEYRSNKPVGQAYMYSQLYNFAFFWSPGESGGIDLQLGSYDQHDVDNGKSIVVIESFYYPEVTENW